VIQVLGSRTSPFVRRVRIVAAELGAPFELVDSTSESGQERLRAWSPLQKIPVARFGDEVVLDSHSIIDRLIAEYGYGPLRAADDLWPETRVAHVIDGALDAAINVFYLRRDGVGAEVPYLAKQEARVDRALAWLAEHWTPEELGLTEVMAITTLDWMRFRAVRPVAEVPRFAELLVRYADRPSFNSTRPGV